MLFFVVINYYSCSEFFIGVISLIFEFYNKGDKFVLKVLLSFIFGNFYSLDFVLYLKILDLLVFSWIFFNGLLSLSYFS